MDKGTIDERLDAYFAEDQGRVEAKETHEEAMPATEASSEPENTQTATDSINNLDELKLPEDSSERTRQQFEKLKTYSSEKDRKIRELEEKLASQGEPKQEYQSIFDGITASPAPENPAPYNPGNTVPTPYLNPSQNQNLVQQFVDQDGNVDLNALNKALSDANRMAYEAYQRSLAVEQRNAQIRQDEEVKEAHSKHPEIDPTRKDTFDKNLYEMVRDRMVRNMWEGKTERLADVVSSIKGMYQPQVNREQINREVAAEQVARQQARNQGPFENGGVERTPERSREDLRSATRRGGEVGDRALSERLRALGI